MEIDGFVPWNERTRLKNAFPLLWGRKISFGGIFPPATAFISTSACLRWDDGDYRGYCDGAFGAAGCKRFNEYSGAEAFPWRAHEDGNSGPPLIHRPDILFLDEPTIGLDLLSQQKIREFLKIYNERQNTTVIITSHYMADIEALCDRAMIINQGHLVYDGEAWRD